jgi:hypothetical protein
MLGAPVKAESTISVQGETLTLSEEPPPESLAAEPAAPRASRKFTVGRGWIIAHIALFMVVGLIAIAVADETSVRGGNYGDAVTLFFAGLVATFLPAAMRALTRGATRNERFALVIALGLALYAVKIIGSPTSFTFFDEYIHLRNTQNILATHHLFGLNPLLPSAPYYPGLAAVCAGLVNLTGLSPFVSGLLIIGAARLLISACFFLIAEKVTGSAVAAAGASLLYAANPMFLFWSSSFSYENLALPLAVFVIWWIARTRDEASRLIPVITVIAIVAVTVTHHISAFALTALLGAWWLAEFLFRRSGPKRSHGVGPMALAAGSASLAWFFLVAHPAEYYLFGENILPILQQLEGLLSGRVPPRHPYAAGGVVADPAWYVLAGFAALALIVLALLPALYRALRLILRGRAAGADGRRVVNVALIIAMVMAAAFPASQLLRLTANGDTIAGRSSEYLFTGLGCVLALLAEKRIHSDRIMTWPRSILAAGLATVVLIGATTIANTYSQLLPEVSNPQGYPFLVQPDTIAASVWAREHLGVNQVFAVDVIDSQALATYGDQDTVSYAAWPIFLNPTMNAAVVSAIKAEKVRYLFVDWQMAHGIPVNPGNYYFSPWEPQAGQYTKPLPTVMLSKFATTNCARVIYHSGLIQIFDVTSIENGSCLPSTATPGNGGEAAP